jgi:hypothetical protein
MRTGDRARDRIGRLVAMRGTYPETTGTWTVTGYVASIPALRSVLASVPGHRPTPTNPPTPTPMRRITLSTHPTQLPLRSHHRRRRHHMPTNRRVITAAMPTGQRNLRVTHGMRTPIRHTRHRHRSERHLHGLSHRHRPA